MMGTFTFLIGLVPAYAQIGVAAPLLMTMPRLIQGIAMGEWGGAVLMAFEYAPQIAAAPMPASRRSVSRSAFV